MLIDSHCHLQALAPAELAAALEAARSVGVTGFLVPALHLDEAEPILELCARETGVWCALGVHPHEASRWRSGKDQARLEPLLAEPGVVAVGECGLDFYYDNSPRDVQIRCMREQWEVAVEHGLPVVVHNRDSNDEMLQAADDPAYAALRADFHSFSGGLAMAEPLIAAGHYLGISGMVTFKKADNVREVLPALPSDRFLVETDTPYLAPVPYRGKPNRPRYVVEIAQRVAGELDRSVDEIAERSTANFFSLFERAAG